MSTVMESVCTVIFFTTPTSSTQLYTHNSIDMAPISTNNTNLTTGLTALADAATRTTSIPKNTIDGIDGNTLHCEDEVIEVSLTKHPLDNATLEDVDCIDEEKHETMKPVQPAKKGVVDYVTKITTINGISITNLPLPSLRKFCAANNIFDERGGSLRKAQKHVLCDRIVWYIENPLEAKKLVRKTSSKTKSNCDPTQVNRIRLINVLFGDAVRPILHTRNHY